MRDVLLEASFVGHLVRLVFWTIVAGMTALPSWLWAGVEDFDRAGILVGVAIWIVILTAVTGTAAFARILRRNDCWYAFLIALATRVGVSLLFPLGMVVDLLPGLLSHAIVRRLWTTPAHDFGPTTCATLLQGGWVVVGMLLFAMLVFSGIRRPQLPLDRCAECGYDIRGSRATGRCPECGTVFTTSSLVRRPLAG